MKTPRTVEVVSSPAVSRQSHRVAAVTVSEALWVDTKVQCTWSQTGGGTSWRTSMETHQVLKLWCIQTVYNQGSIIDCNVFLDVVISQFGIKKIESNLVFQLTGLKTL